MKKSILALVFILTMISQLSAAPLDQKQLIGKWEYAAPTAPPSYTSGQFVFRMEGDKLKGELIIEGQKVDFSSIVIKEDELAVTVYLESTPVTTKMKLVDQTLEGKAETPDGPVAVKATKKK